MIVAVLDTNTVVSGVLQPLGISNQLLEAARFKRFLLVTSHPIIDEVVTTLNRQRIQRKYRITAADILRIRHLLERETIPTPISQEVHGIATHPEDDLILATAVSARADYLVTGDKKLQRLGTYQGVNIVSPRRFLEILGEDALGEE